MEQLNIEQNLLKEGLISAEQLETIKLEQQRGSVSVIKAIRKLKFIPEDKLIGFLKDKLKLSEFVLDGFSPAGEMHGLFPSDYLQKNYFLPLANDGNELAVGMLDPLDNQLLDELRFRCGLFVRPYLIREEEFYSLFRVYSSKDITDQPSGGEASVVTTEKSAAVEAVDLLLRQAVKAGASDIHMEPYKSGARLRLRIDGVLKEISPADEDIYAAVVSRIKIMSNLDIAERRLPQDGRITLENKEGNLDVRVSVIPTIQGESVVLRLLKQTKQLITLEEMGMAQSVLEKYLRMIQQPSGLILVTGPTGSGKTTTLYASLSSLQGVEKNIITIEDPVEYKLDLCRQIQVNPKVGLNFSAGLRSILRHDPDIIMVGEIRDAETASFAIQAALTGHLVFSTLHTNDAVSAITRLIDMGIEPFLIASALNGVLAQRLVRVLCPACKTAVEKSESFQPQGRPGEVHAPTYTSCGCQKCLNTGFSGRVGIFEIMEMTPLLGRMTVEKASSEEMDEYCRKQGMRFLSDDGWQKIIAGKTSQQELVRVLGA